MFWNKYPYSDFHELNLDWILRKIKEMEKSLSEFEALNKITFDGEWDITKQYPAWCIVNTNGGTEGYISIKPVPSGVTIDNIEYWSSIVNYTAIIADLQNRVIQLESDMSTAQNQIAKVTARVADHVATGKYVFLGDSYGSWGGGWIQGVLDGTGITDYYNYVVDGHGFTTATSWQDDLEQFATDHPDQVSEVTDILMVGGINDATDTALTTLGTAVLNFCNYVAANFPKAKITFAFVGNCMETSTYKSTHPYGNVLEARNHIFRVLTNAGHYYSASATKAMWSYNFFDADGLHPNSTGQIRGIVPAVICALNHENYSPGHFFNRVNANRYLEYVDGENSIIKLYNLALPSGITFSNAQWFDVYDAESTIASAYHEPVPCVLDVLGSPSVRYNAKVRMYNRKLQVAVVDTVNSTTYASFSTNSTTVIQTATLCDPLSHCV